MKKSIKRTKHVTKKELVGEIRKIAKINADVKTTLKKIQDTFPKHSNESLVVLWKPEDKVIPYTPEKKKEKTDIDLEVAKYRRNETYQIIIGVESFPSPEFQMWDNQHPLGTYRKSGDYIPAGSVVHTESPQELSFWQKIKNWFRSQFE